MLSLILLVFAFVFFAIAAFNVATTRVNLIAAGLALVTLAEILGSAQLHGVVH